MQYDFNKYFQQDSNIDFILITVVNSQLLSTVHVYKNFTYLRSVIIRNIRKLAINNLSHFCICFIAIYHVLVRYLLKLIRVKIKLM